MRIYFLPSLLVFSLLLGCQKEPRDYNFFMTHPQELQQAADQCQIKASAECNVVRQAYTDFSAIIEQHNNDPQEFGKRILAAQTKLVETKQALAKASGENKEKLEKDYQKQKYELAVMAAVVAAMTGIE